MRVGPWFDPIEEQRLAVDLELPPPPPHLAERGAHRRADRCGSPATSTVRRRRRTAVGRPSRRGHQRGGSSTSRVHCRWLSPAAERRRRVCLRPGACGRRDRGRSRGPRAERRAAPVSGSARRRASRRAAAGPAPRWPRCTAHGAGRGGPGRSRGCGPAARGRRGSTSGSRLSQWEKTPVMRRLAVRSSWRRARDLDRERRARRAARSCSVDLERVREEVALGRAEVVAVEPDVAVVEDAVELRNAPVRLRGRGARSGAGRAAGRRSRANAGGRAPVAGHGDARPVAVVEAGSTKRWWRSPSAIAGRASVPTRSIVQSLSAAGHGATRARRGVALAVRRATGNDDVGAVRT